MKHFAPKPAMTATERPLSKLPKADRELLESARSVVSAGSAAGLKKLLPALTTRGLLDHRKVVPLHNTLLHLAVEEGHIPLVTLLLDASADIESPDYRKCTPLMRAIKNRRLFELLISRGARIDARDTHEQTVLHHAAHDQRAPVELFGMLIAAGADIRTVGNAGRTALHHAAASGSVAKTRFLIEAGADVNAVADGQQGTPLHYVGTATHLDPARKQAVIDVLLAAGAR